ncbi:MAG: hypothetical protein ACI31M_00340 [Bacilli bacterium]
MIKTIYQELLEKYKVTKDKNIIFAILKLFNIKLPKIFKDSTALFAFNKVSFKYEDDTNNIFCFMRIFDGNYEITYYDENGCKTTDSFFLDDNEPFYSYSVLDVKETGESTVLRVIYKGEYDEYCLYKEIGDKDNVEVPFEQYALVNEKKEIVLKKTIIDTEDSNKLFTYNNDLYCEIGEDYQSFIIKFGSNPIKDNYSYMEFDDLFGNILEINNPVLLISTYCDILRKRRPVLFLIKKVNSYCHIEIEGEDVVFLSLSEMPFRIPVTDNKNLTSKDIEIILRTINNYAFEDYTTGIYNMLEKAREIAIKKESAHFEDDFSYFFKKATSFKELSKEVYENIDEINNKINNYIENNPNPITLKYQNKKI